MHEVLLLGLVHAGDSKFACDFSQFGNFLPFSSMMSNILIRWSEEGQNPSVDDAYKTKIVVSFLSVQLVPKNVRRATVMDTSSPIRQPEGP